MAEAQGPTFTQPVRQIVTMLVIVAVVGVGTWFAWTILLQLFLPSLLLNSTIAAVFVIGILTTFWQVAQVFASVRWIEGFLGRRPPSGRGAPTLLAPLAALLSNRAGMQISAGSNRSILDSVGQRMDEARDITRYLANLLIFLGLLGTFFGLATSVPAMVETIRNLAPQQGESAAQAFTKLMSGLESQLGAMGTAFSCSLLGLAGSLVVGLLDLFSGHGQNRFYRELEDWLSTITRVGIIGGDSSDEEKILVQLFDALAVQLQDQAAAVREVLADHAKGREELGDQVTRMAQSFDRIARRLESDSGQSSILTRMLAAQEATYAQLEAQTQATADLAKALTTAPDAGAQVDAESRMRLRSIDVQLLRILEEISAGRQETTADLRADLAALTAAIRHAGRGAGIPAKG